MMEQRIKNEQLKLLFAGLPASLLVTLLLMALTATVSALTSASNVILACLGLLLVTALRTVLWLAYRRYAQRASIPWAQLFFAGCFIAGTAWGAAAVIVFPHDDIALQAFLSFLIGGVSAAAVTTLAIDQRAFLAFVVPCVLPLAVRLYVEPGVYERTMAVMVGLYSVIIIAAGLRLHRKIVENIWLRLEAAERQRSQRRSERALEIANRNLRQVIDAADHVAIIALDVNGIITMINRGAEKMLGYAEGELVGRLTLELLMDADEVQDIANHLSTQKSRLFGLPALLQYTRENGSYSRHCIFVGKQEQRLHVDLVLTATRVENEHDDGNINGFLATAIDVGERKRAAEALTRLNERFKLATHSGGMGIWDWDVAADTLLWDERTYEIYGAPRGLTPDMNYMLRIVHPQDVERTRAELIAALKAEQQLHTSFRIICPSGEERTVNASGLTLRNSEGRAVRMTGLVWDVTAVHRVERMKNEFVATVSHELRTPLTSIRGSLGLVAAGAAGKLPDKAAGLVNMALNNCERLTLLINDILDMEKLESDEQRFDVRRVDVSELVGRSLADNAGFGHSLSVHFTTPEPLCHADVMVDSSRFLQVMANLLSNASKFSPAGAAVEVSAHQARGQVRVSVRDLGRGIPPEFQPRLFQKFSQADSSDSRTRDGTGLGLAISRAIVERLGGRIGFDTGPGGTTFYIELPEAGSLATHSSAQTQSQAS